MIEMALLVAVFVLQLLQITLIWRAAGRKARRAAVLPSGERPEKISWSITHVPCVGPNGGFTVRLMNGKPPPDWLGLHYTGQKDADGRYVYGE